MVTEHLSGYQARDKEVVDYQMYQLGETGLFFRGPKPVDLSPGTHFTCIGAAQTLGCFCDAPFPTLLQKKLGMTALNLGYGGAGPRFFAKYASLISYVNSGRFAIVQIMSGRSEDNSLFDSGGLEFVTRRSDGKKFGAGAAWDSVLECRYAWKKMPFCQGIARAICHQIGRRRLRRLIAETRANWCQSYVDLLGQITVPTILFWFSKRRPDYQDGYARILDFFNDFPQLVNRDMINQIRPLGNHYVECVTDRGSPQPLRSRFTGQPVTIDLANDRPDFAGRTWTHNAYYPSPEMHVDAAEELFREIRIAAYLA